MSENYCPTLFEYLPNELFGEIFNYLNVIDAFYAFSYLNCRFQCLIFEYKYQSFDFKSIDKYQFDTIFQFFDKKQWKLLRLYNDDDTYGQIEYFFENYSLIKHFPQLKSLSIISLKPLDESTLLSQLPFLSNLVSLTLQSICGEKMSQFNLPNLKKLIFSSCTNTKWIQNFSQIEIIEYTITDCYRYELNLIWPSKLKRLKIIFTTDEDENLVQHSLTNLSQLIILEIYQKVRGLKAPDGHEWEDIIRFSLPLLKKFKFYFQFEYILYTINELNQIFKSFFTPFYEFEKQWFVRFNIHDRDRQVAAIYSLPFSFDRFSIMMNSSDKCFSSLINDDIYTNIKTLVFEEKSATFEKIFSRIQMINLVLNSYFDCVNWVHILTKLCHLEIQSSQALSSEYFSFLLNNTPYLYSLVVDKNVLSMLTENWKNVFICKQLSEKIRSLKLTSNDHRLGCLNEIEIEQIIRIFASKCQHLSLCIYSEIITIRSLLQNMRQLISLHIRIQGKDYPPIDIEWLNKKKSEIKFTHSDCFIVNDGYDRYFWLGKHSS